MNKFDWRKAYRDSDRDICGAIRYGSCPVSYTHLFDKIKLKVGESRTVTFDVKDEQLGFYNNQMKFVVEKGDFTFMVGGNSRDLQEIKYTLN